MPGQRWGLFTLGFLIGLLTGMLLVLIERPAHPHPAGPVPVLPWAGPEPSHRRFLPDLKLTPGALVSLADPARPGPVSLARREQVLREYRLAAALHGEYVINLLIPAELGGSGMLANLWPESRLTQPWNAGHKAALDARLGRELALGLCPLGVMRRQVATDWLACWQRHFHQSLPDPSRPLPPFWKGPFLDAHDAGENPGRS